MAYLPEKARSELVTPTNFSAGGVVDTIFMFQAACAAVHCPAASPTRRSGVGAVADTMGVTGGGMTLGGGGVGGGGVPRPPRPSAGAAAAPDGAGSLAAVDGAAAGAVGGGADAVGADAVGAAAGAAGLAPAGEETEADFGAHATASRTTARDAKTTDLMNTLRSPGDEADFHYRLRCSGAESIFCMRSISVVWSAYMSDANLKMSSSCMAPYEPNNSSTILMAPS